ncbi:fumarylacetoacetate hydrolase family protein [Nocardia fluminea]
MVYERHDSEWVDAPELAPLGPTPFSSSYEISVDDAARAQGATACLPFQPLSFRDFMLYEQHNIRASRGLVERFHPIQHRVTSAWESATGKTFPLFRPNALFYRQPMYYMSNHVTFVPSTTPISAPGYSSALDFELELGFALARPLRNATPQEAVQAIGAFVVLNDLSARDVQRAEMSSGFGPQKAKHFASSLSETAVTAEGLLDRIDAITGTVAINGTVISEVTSAGMQWTLGEMLAHASASETLRPGELFGTGTLPGGSGMELGYWLQPGDHLTLTLDGIGTIEHGIVA